MTDPFDQRFACIVGAPRCGTTSLARYLQNHPSVCFSRVKEPHFFSQRDLTGLSDQDLHRTVRDEYLARYYTHIDGHRPLMMDGSVTYLYAANQMRPILRLWPEARFIIGLRDPMEMIPSLHQRLLFLGDETVEEFELAWRLIGERREGRRVPPSCIEARWLRYDEVGRLGHYVEQFVAAVGRERCHFILHDDVKAEAAAAYRGVLEFLELPPLDFHDPTPKRTSRGYRIGWLQRLLMRPPGVTRKLIAGTHYRRRVEAIEKLRGKESAALRLVERTRKALLKWNEAEAPPVHLSSAMRAEIRGSYGDDVKRLSRIIGRDLSHWLAE